MKNRIYAILLLLCMILSGCAAPPAEQPPAEQPPAQEAPVQQSETPQQPAAPSDGQPLATVYNIDVGQGDSTLIDVGEYEILIDGGERKAGDTVVEFLSDKVDGKLELVVATHPDADHIGGLIDAINAYPPAEIIDSGKEHTTKTYKEYLMAAESSGALFTEDADRTIPIADNVTFAVIECADNESENNNNSVVTCLNVGSQKLLFVGDMETPIEQEYINNFSDVDYLKVGHHGSHTASSSIFLDKIKPEYAVISCGLDNRYGHPHQETLDTLTNQNVQTYRTDQQGTITTKCFSDHLELQSER